MRIINHGFRSLVHHVVSPWLKRIRALLDAEMAARLAGPMNTKAVRSAVGIVMLGCLAFLLVRPARAAEPLAISWTNNLLTVSGPHLPGTKLDIWYLEAFCRRGSTDRDWRQTTLPHKTELIFAGPAGRELRFRTRVEPNVEVLHQIQAGSDELDIRFSFKNNGEAAVDLEWFQPACIRVERFTGCVQSNYTARSFIFAGRGLTRLDQCRRTEEARYRGGQVYVPHGIDLADVNPRPICLDRPVNGLIGCFSADDQWLFATASDQTQEVFEGVYVCLHSDPRVGGLKAKETKTIRSKIYLMKNDPKELLARYQRDFGK
jgi:hypothetical protein